MCLAKSKKKKKTVALPAVWFSSLLLFHVTTGTECEQPISLAAGELLHCWTRPNIWNFLHLSHIFLHTSFTAQQSLCGSSASHTPTRRMQSWWHFFPKLAQLVKVLIQTTTPTLMGRENGLIASAPAPPPTPPFRLVRPLLIFMSAHVFCLFVCFQNLFVELRANKAGRHRDPNGNWH